MNRKTKGRIAEVKALCHFIEQGYECYLPFSDCSKYDLLIAKDGVVSRVSVKYTSEQKPSGKWRVCLRQSSRRNDGTMHVQKFDNSQYDLVAAYVGPEDRMIVLDTQSIKGLNEVHAA